jgi:RNA polymerase sigma factor (sigma-70 family)
MSAVPEFDAWLSRHRADVLRFVERRAGGALIRMESAEDLAQDVCARALRHAGRVELRDEPSFRAWLFEIARNHLEDRRDYWSALKRSGSDVLRLGVPDGARHALTDVVEVAASVTGPSTFAVRREQLAIAAKALALLLPRDRALVEGLANGLTAAEQAAALSASVVTVESARKRALERFRKTFRLVAGQRSGPPRPAD